MKRALIEILVICAAVGVLVALVLGSELAP